MRKVFNNESFIANNDYLQGESARIVILNELDKFSLYLPM